MKNLKTMAFEINVAATQYQMGQFHEIRRQIRGLSRVKDHRIFTPQTIHENWAFHSGGRTELQFNIGFETDDRQWFRYGVAFSLEASQTLPKPLILKPKILKLNDYLTRHAVGFEDLRFWYHGDQKSPVFPIGPIPKTAIQEGTFLFWGKLCPREDADPHAVLFLFDRLLNLYRHVEGGQTIGQPERNLKKGFVFKPGCTPKLEDIVLHSPASIKSIALRHNEMQVALHRTLCAEFGPDHVGTENDTGRGARIDLVVQHGDRYIYYEIKPYPCIRSCIRLYSRICGSISKSFECNNRCVNWLRR